MRVHKSVHTHGKTGHFGRVLVAGGNRPAGSVEGVDWNYRVWRSLKFWDGCPTVKVLPKFFSNKLKASESSNGTNFVLFFYVPLPLHPPKYYITLKLGLSVHSPSPLPPVRYVEALSVQYSLFFLAAKTAPSGKTLRGFRAVELPSYPLKSRHAV